MPGVSVAPPEMCGVLWWAEYIACVLCLPPVQSPESPFPWVLPKPPCRFPLAPSWLL